VTSPNVLVWTQPDLPLPHFELPRFEMKEAESSRPEQEALQAKAAPDVETVADTIDLESLQPIQRLRYQAEPAAQQRPDEQALKPLEAPDVVATQDTTLDPAELQEFDRLRYWTAEQKREAPKEQAALASPAPKVGGAVSSGFSLEQIQPVPKLRFQMKATAAQGPITEALDPTLAPALADLVPAGPRGETGANAILATANASLAGIPPPPPSPTNGASGGEAGTLRPARERRPASSSGSKAGGPSAAADREGRKLAVVGVKPSATGTVPLGRRRGSFSASPNGGPGGDGVPQTPGAGVGVRIPNLSISGRPRASFAAVASVASLARAADGPASPERFDRGAFLAKLRNRPLNDTTFGNFETEPTPENPEAGFSGRRVHTLAINMPNINSGAGSWIVRFSEAQGARSKGKLFAPAPRVKVDPTYARAAISERVEGEVILSAVIRNDGVVDHVKLVKSVDERLDTAAIAALGKWKFHPALKGGVPVDVEVVVRIPFRLKPLQDP
jgi:TonB family protein